ncbi:MAG: preprotein translocase subunit SecE [Erysipelotrichales bacterium]|nr:preprotein translocase subunit SecE [Erysipelotrichales bacterium]
MQKIKDFFAGVVKEGKRVRWPNGEQLSKLLVTVLAYAVVFGGSLVLFDFVVLKLLQAINFS